MAKRKAGPARKPAAATAMPNVVSVAQPMRVQLSTGEERIGFCMKKDDGEFLMFTMPEDVADLLSEMMNGEGAELRSLITLGPDYGTTPDEIIDHFSAGDSKHVEIDQGTMHISCGSVTVQSGDAEPIDLTDEADIISDLLRLRHAATHRSPIGEDPHP